MLHEHILVIDTETGGLDPHTHSILSIGLASWCGTDTREIFVLEPDLQTNPRYMEINSIDLDWIREHGVSTERACEQIDDFIAQLTHRPLTLAGHNISFDLAFLRRLYRLAGRAQPSAFSHRSLDTHSLLWLLAQQGHLPPQVCSSDGGFSYFDVTPPDELRHTALGDAIATRLMLRKLLDYMSEVSSAHLESPEASLESTTALAPKVQS